MAKRRSTTPKGGSPTRKTSSRQNQRLYRNLTWLGGALVAIGVIVGLALLVQSNVALAGAPGERIPIQGADHIARGQVHAAYNSDPPTSGPHYVDTVDAEFYETPQLDEMLVNGAGRFGYPAILHRCHPRATLSGDVHFPGCPALSKLPADPAANNGDYGIDGHPEIDAP